MSADYRKYPFIQERHPSGWLETTIGEIALEIQSGYSSGKHNQTGQGIPHLRPMNVSPFGEITMEDVRYVSPNVSDLRLAEDDVLITNTSSTIWVGKTALVPKSADWGFSNHMTRLRVADGMSPDFVAWQLHYLCICGYFAFHCKKHINQSSISGKQLTENVPFRLPPADEQKRIASKFRRLLDRERQLRQELEALPLLIQQYRAAVMEAACSGQLVPTEAQVARREKREFEPASALLERILSERRAKWESDQLAKFCAANKDPGDEKWKENYPYPLGVNNKSSTSLPDGWSFVSLDQISHFITSGSREWGRRYSEEGKLLIRAQDIKTDTLNIEQAVRVRATENAETERSKVSNGDLLITITGANVAKAALTSGLNETAFVSQHVGLARPVLAEVFLYSYVWIISSANGRSQLEKAAYGTGKPGLNLRQLKEVTIALPPLAEQKRITFELERRLSGIDRISEQVKAALEQGDHLKMSLFYRAFSGELTTRKDTDESAANLLTRIRVERESQRAKAKQSKPKRKTKMKKLSSELVKETIWKLPGDCFSFEDLSAALEADYDPLKDIVFELLDEPKPFLKQVFNLKAKQMQFQRVKL